jgi:non-specific serine/threonine protein kinase
MIGKTISHFKILEKLGEGGMGAVYKATDTNLDRIVALKFLPRSLLSGKEEKARFVHEARAASALNHPNIMTIHEIHEADDELFIVMECIEGESLSDKLKQGPLKTKELIKTAISIADGLNAAHEKDIVHRDVKSENIKYSTTGQAKILDFGLAKQKGMSKVTQTGSTIGTQGYMSPEQVEGLEVDKRSDIFSFGVVLYEMATGRLPFEGEHEAAILYSIMNEEPIPVTTRNPNISQDLERIIHKALEKNAKDRYQHADEMLADLRKLKKGGTSDKPPKPQQKKRLPVYIFSIIVLMVVGVLLYWINNKPQTSTKSIAVLPFTSIDRTEESEIFSDGIHDDILSQIAKIHDLKVVSRTSVMRYRDTDMSMSEIAKELNVETILEGSVRRSGEKVRIVAQLIKAKTDEHLWTETYDRNYADLFAVQSDVAENIASALKATLTPEEISSIENVPTENMEAYDYYLRGKYYWDIKIDREGNMLAAEMLEKAVELDSSFTLAYTLLAQVNFTLYSWGLWDPTPERLEKGMVALKQATRLAPNFPEVHYARAIYYSDIEKDNKKALIEFLIALEGRPNDSWINQSTGLSYMALGEWDKAEQYLLKSYELDPHGLNMAIYVTDYYMRMRDWRQAEYYIDKSIASLPEHPVNYYFKAVIALMEYGDTEKASRIFEDGAHNVSKRSMLRWRPDIDILTRRFQDLLDGVEPFPDFDDYFLYKGIAYWFMGQKSQAYSYLDSARVVNERLIQTAPQEIGIYGTLGIIYAGLGMKEKAIRSAKKAVELEPISKNTLLAPGRHKDLAYVYSMVGEYDKALDEIELLLSIPYWFTTWDLKLSPYWDPLRDHPRFQELIAKYSD